MNAANNALARGDHAAAAAEFQKLAEQGDKKAQANLGYMYYVGEGVEQDYAKAVKWYKKAAILGDMDSQYNLAVAYAFGEGVKQSYKEAFHWYRRAAEQNHAIAQYSLGVSYAYGEGIAQNPELAAEWIKKSAEQGYERAQVLLGSLYHTGDGVEKNYEQAAIWYRKAADMGDAAAQYNLGTLYRSGNGVDKDYNQAIRWFRLSADQGYAAAQNELASMERAIAGANRATPVSVPETVQTESVPTESDKEPSQIPTMAKPEPGPKPVPESEVAAVEEPTEPETIESPAPDSTESTTEVEEKPKWGFFSKLFGKKDAVDPEPEQSGAVNETPGEGAAPENKYMTTLGSRAVVVEKNVTTEPESIEAPVPDTSEVATEAEEKPKRGFFSKLFGKKDPVDPEPEQDDVSVEIVSPEPGPTVELEAKLIELKTQLEAVPESDVAAVEEPTEHETVDPPAPDTNEPQIIGVVSQIDEESSEVFTYAADSAPAGQQLEPSTEVEITVAQLDPVETPTQLPVDSTLTEPELIVED